ncbi:MAG: type I 3-dehydroquinate dehydratase [Chloroflexi bacterium]|nr:type I 3-dehydroquinate dehydratase [Chloroflexota bacterium]
MTKPRVCAVITGRQPQALQEIESLVDLFEVRIDLIGEGWRDIAATLRKPWIACNRLPREGGRWAGSEAKRLDELADALKLGAKIIDLELSTPDLKEACKPFKKATLLLSYHDLSGTPPLEDLRGIVGRQLDAGAGICKVVTTARDVQDNLTAVSLITSFPKARIVAFAMGPLGMTSRILCPLAGGYFTYAATGRGSESAPGQVTAAELRRLYVLLGHD